MSREASMPPAHLILAEEAKKNARALEAGTIPLAQPITEEPSFANLKTFVNFAAANQFHYLVSQDKSQTDNAWATRWNQLGLYLYTDLTLQEIGNTYQVKRQTINYLLRRTVSKLYNASPTILQEAIPDELFNYGKPPTLAQALRISNARGGHTEAAIQLAQAGKTPAEIQALLGITTDQLASIRYKSQKYGIDIPYINNASSKPYRENQQHFLADPSSSPEERQKALEQWLSNYATKKNHRVVNLSHLFKEAGINPHKFQEATLPTIIQVVKQAGLPAHLIERTGNNRTLRYGIVAQADKEAILEFLRTSPDLEPFRKAKLPTEATIFTAQESTKLPPADS
jgi:hypothetical protein